VQKASSWKRPSPHAHDPAERLGLHALGLRHREQRVDPRRELAEARADRGQVLLDPLALFLGDRAGAERRVHRLRHLARVERLPLARVEGDDDAVGRSVRVGGELAQRPPRARLDLAG